MTEGSDTFFIHVNINNLTIEKQYGDISVLAGKLDLLQAALSKDLIAK
ncbi:MAG: hypothetical protein ACREVX_00505 [Clostridium sp.]